MSIETGMIAMTAAFVAVWVVFVVYAEVVIARDRRQSRQDEGGGTDA